MTIVKNVFKQRWQKRPFPKVERNYQLLDLIHSDIYEINDMLKRGERRYFIIFIDNYSRFTHVHLLRTKNDAFEKFKEFKKMVENQKEKKIKILRSDIGGEYFSRDFSIFCDNILNQNILGKCIIITLRN